MTYQTGGSPETVGDNGWVVDQGNYKVIQQAICEKRQTDELPAKFFSTEMVETYARLYENVKTCTDMLYQTL